MEIIKEFNQYQKATSSDLNDMGTGARASLDHVVGDGIVGGTRGYTGFNTVKSATTQVTTAAGRLYNIDGSVYFRNDPGGSVTDFLNFLPAVSQRIATIVVAGNAPVDTDTQSREFLIDVVNRTTQAKTTATESWRQATVTYVLGSESASPTAPSLDSHYLGIANVLLSPSGVVSVTMLTANHLPSVQTAYQAAITAEAEITALAPKIATLDSDITQLSQSLSGCAQKDFTLRMAADVAKLKQVAGLPANYADYGADFFLDTSLSNPAATGYAASVADGLRFPMAATTGPSGSALALANPLDPTVSQDTSGLILPAYTEYRWREIDPNNGELALSTFNYNPSVGIVVTSMASARASFGPYFTVSASSSWWLSTSNYDPVTGWLLKNGQAFQAIPTGQVDPNGAKIYRVAGIFKTSTGSAYWTRTSTNNTMAGFLWVQTFLQSQTVWCTSIGIPFSRLDTSGDVTFGICEVKDDGTPDLGHVLSTTTVPYAQLINATQNHNPNNLRYKITPTLLKAGKRYGIMVTTAGNHWVNVASTVSTTLNGTLFYMNGNTGFFQSDPAHAFMLDIGIAGFTNQRTEVVFNNNALTLGGGIGILDILSQQVVPDSTSLSWAVNINGVWQTFDPAQPSPLTSLPSSIGLKAIFNGTDGIQPGLILPSSQVILSRPATAIKHVSAAHTLAAATTAVQVTAIIENWDAAHHTAAIGLIVGGNPVAASTTTTQVQGNGVIKMVANFTVTSTSSIITTVTGTTTSANNLWCCSNLEYVSS